MPARPPGDVPKVLPGEQVPEGDEPRMRLALDEAREAAARDEVPVGALLVAPDGTLLARRHDERMSTADPTAHAEVLALREGARALGDWRLEGCTLYVTLEPCPMCAGALILARVERVVFGAPSAKGGAVVTHVRLLDVDTLNHRVAYAGGVLEEECAAVLTAYFRARRRRANGETGG